MAVPTHDRQRNPGSIIDPTSLSQFQPRYTKKEILPGELALLGGANLLEKETT